MNKRNLIKERQSLYTTPRCCVVCVEVPPMHFLMIDGQERPCETRVFHESVEALMLLANTVRAKVKACGGTDYVVMPLEGMWRDIEGEEGGPYWTLMIMQPEWVSQTVIDTARQVLRAKGCCTPLMDRIRFEIYEEGPSIQVLHIGSLDREGSSLNLLHEKTVFSGYQITGRHHEIYLKDPRRTAPEKLRTLIRYGVRIEGS